MKVMMNLFPLGGRFKTGIYRVAEELASGVASELGRDLSFQILGSPKGSLTYFQKKLADSGAKLHLCRSSVPLYPLANFIEDFLWKSKSQSLPARGVRWGLAQTMNAIEKHAAGIPHAVLAKQDIYHSPYAQIPPEVRACKSVIKCTTIYDLLPISHPDLFPKHTLHLVNSIMGSLTEEDYTFSISEATRQDLLTHTKCQPERSFVVPLAASSHFHPLPDRRERQAILAKYKIPADNYILSLCTFEIRKNLQIVIRAFGTLHREKSIPAETRLVLVGPAGWKNQQIEEALSEIKDVQDKVIILGFVPDEDLAAIYSAARVFAYMSILEGFGLPPLEAMQCGTPAITSNTSSLPEVMGTSGTMLEPHDFDGLCDAIQRHYSDDGFHEKMASNALQRAKCFSWDDYISRTLEIYRMSLEGRGT